MLEEFLKFVNDSKGKISSQRFRETYFVKMGKENLWIWFIEETKLLDCYQNSEKMFLIHNGYKEPPRCYCGNPVLVIVGPKGRISEFCCAKCAQKSTSRAQKLSITKNERNKDIEYKNQIETKRKNTMQEKYGVEYNSQRLEIKELLHFKQNFLELPINIIIDEYLSGFSLVALGEKYNVDYSTIKNRLVSVGIDIRLKTNSSIFEDQLSYLLTENNIQHERNIYSIIKKTKQLELDFVIEKHKLAIEINGLYWHSFGIKETKEQKEKHLF